MKKHSYIKNVVTLQLDQSKCIGCGVCTQVCPHGVLAMHEGKAQIADKKHCMECGACAKNCPASAFTVESGVGCAYAIIRGMLMGSEPNCDCDSDSKKKSKNNCC